MSKTVKTIIIKQVDVCKQTRPIELEKINTIYPYVLIDDGINGIPSELSNIEIQLDMLFAEMEILFVSNTNHYGEFINLLADYSDTIGNLTIEKISYLLELYESYINHKTLEWESYLPFLNWKYNQEFELIKLCGSLSVEYTYACVPSNMSDEEIKKLETIIWNTGTQWLVIDSDTNEVLDTVYCYTNNETDELTHYAKENNYHSFYIIKDSESDIKEFKIKVTETRTQYITVYATNKEEAKEIAHTEYEEYRIDFEDNDDTTYDIFLI
ncbi:hypothetical protein SAMN05421767_10431 [Granulicatella balaenopterae]|uniref:Uncharacterized protein n=1 Tax=Granulicatella balaenopterae TaxID=137733 RepID=A0A1H9I282_9LACT|nr:hypothetical protein [Granulicatella balaenopterae]SEQ68565.1 hypothetical protein SAMN05421767_10431 [Granulicatella balaenopterae]